MSKNKKRQQNTAQRQIYTPHYTLVCEGYTEFHYFKHLNRLGKTSVVIKKNYCKLKGEIEAIKQKIDEILRNNGRALCVFDADVDEVRNFLNNYKNTPKVLICDSMPSIEYWFLLHYEEKYGAMTSKEVLTNLKKYVINYDKTEHFLKQPSWVEDMLPYLNSACQRARNNIDGASYSNVYKIFEQQ